MAVISAYFALCTMWLLFVVNAAVVTSSKSQRVSFPCR